MRYYSFGFETGRLEKGDDFGIAFCVAIEDDVTVGARLGKRSAQLLDDPLRIRVSGNIAMQNLAAFVLNDDETVELEGHRRHGEEIERDQRLTVIRQKGAPGVATITAAGRCAGNEPRFVPK